MKLLSLFAASSMLLGATVGASAAHYRVHHYGTHGAYGAFASANGHGTYGRRGTEGARCRLRYGERPEELTQDRSYHQSLGEPC